MNSIPRVLTRENHKKRKKMKNCDSDGKGSEKL